MSLLSIAEPITKAEHHLVEKAPSAAQSISLWNSAWTFDQKLIRAGFLRALLCGQIHTKDKKELIKDLLSLDLVDALIVGSLNLDKCKNIPHLTLDDSVITGGVTLRNAKTGCIHLSRCSILDRDINAAGVSADGAVLLKDLEFAHRSILDFSQAKIEYGCTVSNLSTHPAQATETLRKELEELVAKIAASSPPAITIDPKFANLPNPRQLISDTLSAAASSPSAGQLGDLARLSFKGARIGGDLTIEGLQISTCNHHPVSSHGRCNDAQSHAKEEKVAIDAERVDIKGDVLIQSTAKQDLILRGGVALAFAQIAGNLSIKGIDVSRCACDEALDCEGATIGGHLSLVPREGTPSLLRGGLRVLGAHIKGQLILLGTTLHGGGPDSKTEAPAITGDGVTIDNDLFIRPTDDPPCDSLIIGIVRLLGATIGGQFEICGTCAIANPYKPAPHPLSTASDCSADGNAPSPPAPIPDSELRSYVAALTPPGSLDWITAPAISMRDVTVHGGIFIHQYKCGNIPSKIVGEIQMNDAVVGGVFGISGSTLDAGLGAVALSARGATIDGDVTFQTIPLDDANVLRCQVRGCVEMAGATLKGRFRLLGAEIGKCKTDPRQEVEEGTEGAALILSGSIIKGGFFADVAWNAKQENVWEKAVRCVLYGTFKVNHAEINSRLLLRGVTIHAAQSKSRIALGAIGLILRGDLELTPARGGSVCEVYGEIRLYGAKISGGLEIDGGTLAGDSSGTGFALDGYNSEITRGVILGPVTPRDIQIYCEDRGASEDAVIFALAYPTAASSAVEQDVIDHVRQHYPLLIKGIVGFAYAQLGSLTIGKSKDKPQMAEAVHLRGTLRLDGATVKDTAFIKEVRFTSPGCFPDGETELAKKMIDTLNRWGAADWRTIVSALNSTLGTVFSFKLSEESCGAIELFGAHTATLADWSYQGKKLYLDWGREPFGGGWLGSASLRPDLSYRGVRLGLDGFTYSRFADPDGTEVQLQKNRFKRAWSRRGSLLKFDRDWFKRLVQKESFVQPQSTNHSSPAEQNYLKRMWFSGEKLFRANSYVKPSTGSDWLFYRREWIKQQYPGGKKGMNEETFSPVPYIQLASVFRAHGFNREADEISYDRRKYLVSYGTMNFVDKTLQWFYGVFFGFGYRSWAALLTCLFLFAVNGIFVCIGASHFTNKSAGEPPRPWLAEPKHTGTAPSPLEFHFSFAPATVLAASQSTTPTTQISPSTPAGASTAPKNGCRCRAHKHKPHPSTAPIIFPPQKGEGTGVLPPPKDAPPCACRGLNAALYTFDQTMPLIHVTRGNGCELAKDAPWPYRMWQAVMLLLGWIVIPTAGLTFSGILRETNK